MQTYIPQIYNPSQYHIYILLYRRIPYPYVSFMLYVILYGVIVVTNELNESTNVSAAAARTNHPRAKQFVCVRS